MNGEYEKLNDNASSACKETTSSYLKLAKYGCTVEKSMWEKKSNRLRVLGAKI